MLGWTLLLIGIVVAVILAWRRPGIHTPQGGVGSDHPWPDMRLDINRAPAAELAVLPGIGEAMALRIVGDRASRGPFDSVDDLSRVPGIGDRVLERLRPFVVCEPAAGD